MVRPLCMLAVVALLAAGMPHPSARADEPKRPASPAEARAAEVAGAVGDAEALKQLAAAEMPDPWLVVDVLVRRKRFDAADAFAKEAKGVDVRTLGAYVDAQRTLPQPPQAWAAYDAARTAAAKGDFPGALEHLGDAPEATPTNVTGVRTAQLRGELLHRMRKTRDAHAVFARAGAGARSIGWLRHAAALYRAAGPMAWRGRQFEEALAAFTAHRELSLTRERADEAADALGKMALATGDLGHFEEADKMFVAALAEQRKATTEARVAIALGNHGTVLSRLGRTAEARQAYEESLAIKRRVGDREGEAITLDNIGRLHERFGEFGRALDAFRLSESIWASLEKQDGVADCKRRIGRVLRSNGKYAEALTQLEAGAALAEKADAKRVHAKLLVELARTYGSLGDLDRAYGTWVRALEQARIARSSSTQDTVQRGLAVTHARRKEDDKALALWHAMETKLRARRSRVRLAGVLGNMAVLENSRGDHARALALSTEGLALLEAAGHQANRAFMLRTVGIAHWRLGNTKEAERFLKRAAARARSDRETPWRVRCLATLARFYLDQDKPGRALSAARQGLDLAPELFAGLGAEQGAQARAKIAGLFEAGAIAAAREDDPFEALDFLESGRAGALLDALGHHEAERWRATALSPELRDEERRARAAEAAARGRYDRVVRRGRRDQVAAAREALDAARETVRAVADRIQRDLKQQASIFYPVPKALDDIRETLAPHEAFVLYGTGADESLAVVIRPDSERIVRLGNSDEITKILDDFDPTDTEADAGPTLKVLRAKFVTPLALEADVKRVLISPNAIYAYVPFAALLDRDVVMSPSGTTHVLLRSRTFGRGSGVLAVGAPDYGGVSEGARKLYYRGRSLSALPASRVEVEKIGTAKLLGAAANEVEFAKALATQDRWQAIHFACHGLVDAEHPMLSSLALSRSGDSDGFLTGLEILRMELRTDLAVLSACETARGEVVEGEGIIGLTRAFMFAGAPRVLCSLWKVDDEATQALMLRFYELWRPADGSEGIAASAALRKAQAFVRDHPKHPEWKHPYYWAAWVLWGLP